MWKRWLPYKSYVKKPGGNRSAEDKHTLDVAKKEIYAAVVTAQESKLQELTADLHTESGGKNCFRIARQMARGGRDIISVYCKKMMSGTLCLTLTV